ncbi:hypothetical protein BCR37DRAFT_169454 [Protomyces lactucae-debilis]|uniref:Uncharacterized protein n=1 Tax=Protomyces lactucae-debilis TaxID=2754530 RepID=A0A1Y2EX09_PROLT|nr:uncharacterized protein BCR37DRAFT_169454 [Protomyces lactucae-debilis]ORY76098.1 hypothetical protein BCR37DRAFT_169454 [Protomyces lactucae-debilis]
MRVSKPYFLLLFGFSTFSGSRCAADHTCSSKPYPYPFQSIPQAGYNNNGRPLNVHSIPPAKVSLAACRVLHWEGDGKGGGSFQLQPCNVTTTNDGTGGHCFVIAVDHEAERLIKAGHPDTWNVFNVKKGPHGEILHKFALFCGYVETLYDGTLVPTLSLKGHENTLRNAALAMGEVARKAYTPPAPAGSHSTLTCRWDYTRDLEFVQWNCYVTTCLWTN